MADLSSHAANPPVQDSAAAQEDERAGKRARLGDGNTSAEQVFLEGQLWPPGSWSCPACTLVNLPAADRCGACEGARPGGSNIKLDSCSRVVVVLPPTHENPEEGAEHAAAATARHAAIVAAARGPQIDSTKVDKPADATTNAEPSGVAESLPWRGLGPDGEWIAGPASEARVQRPRAKDKDVDMFADMFADLGTAADNTSHDDPPLAGENSEKTTTEPPQIEHTALKDKSPSTEEAQVVNEPSLIEGPLPDGEAAEVDRPKIESSVLQTARPAWGLGSGPLFSNLEENLPIPGGSRMEDPVLFEDSVSRLSSLGYNPRRCRHALEAAMGDEDLAHTFLAGEV